MAHRSQARQVAFQMLYQKDLNPEVDPQTVRAMIREQIRDEALQRFAWSLFAGVMEWRGIVDARIESVTENWTLARMAPTDRNILRLGVYELLYCDLPHRIAIDEAVELAKRFGTAASSQFVNGILDRLVPDGRRG